MNRYLITSGCSFTAHAVEPNIAWPNHIQDWQVINCAEMASGNSLVSRNLIATIPHYVDKNPTVAVMWSNPNRFELFYNCLLYTSPSPRDPKTSRMPSSA